MMSIEALLRSDRVETFPGTSGSLLAEQLFAVAESASKLRFFRSDALESATCIRLWLIAIASDDRTQASVCLS